MDCLRTVSISSATKQIVDSYEQSICSQLLCSTTRSRETVQILRSMASRMSLRCLRFGRVQMPTTSSRDSTFHFGSAMINTPILTSTLGAESTRHIVRVRSESLSDLRCASGVAFVRCTVNKGRCWSSDGSLRHPTFTSIDHLCQSQQRPGLFTPAIHR